MNVPLLPPVLIYLGILAPFCLPNALFLHCAQFGTKQLCALFTGLIPENSVKTESNLNTRESKT